MLGILTHCDSFIYINVSQWLCCYLLASAKGLITINYSPNTSEGHISTSQK